MFYATHETLGSSLGFNYPTRSEFRLGAGISNTRPEHEPDQCRLKVKLQKYIYIYISKEEERKKKGVVNEQKTVKT